MSTDIREQAKAYYSDALPEEREAGHTWYDAANRFARDLADETGESISNVARVIAVTSPNQTWKGNQTLAAKHLRTGWIGGLPAQRKHLANGTISGRKVTNFAKAIEGDERAVVIDRWMIRAFGAPMGRAAYPDLEQGITDAADELGISPRALQATIWVVVRGRSE